MPADTGEICPRKSPLGDRLNAIGLRLFFRLASVFPRTVDTVKPLFVRIAYACSPSVQRNTAANGRKIFGSSVSAKKLTTYGRGVLLYFLDFVLDVRFSLRASSEQLADRISAIEGHERYMATRVAKRGAILLTAHMGSFELGIVALQQYESRIHVVFKRDAVSRFEKIRGGMRQRLGVLEAAVDDGWVIWMRLRDALRNDDVVLIQGDRVMPGQRGMEVPFLHGRIILPTGPVKLASASGAPIVAVFCLRDPDGRVRLIIDEAIDVPNPLSDDDLSKTMQRIAAMLERYVGAYPEQWLMLHPAFCDQTPAG